MKNKKSSKKKEKDVAKSSISSTLGSIVIGIAACWVGVYLSTFIGSKTDQVRDVTVGRENVQKKSFNITCSEDYKEHPIFKGCTPTKVCGRAVRDDIVTDEEVERLLGLAKRGFHYGGSNGGASILDLHSGALSKGDKFVNIYKFLDKNVLEETFPEEDFEFYSDVRSRVQTAISEEFGIDPLKLHLTHPTFFSRITSNPAKTQHDEYWHKHIDKIQYGSFDYTSLLYLGNYGTDFSGGRFIFDNENMKIEPKRGRLSFFTSGSENPHHVEKVESGTRYAMTISFTCDPKKGIEDPSL